MSPFWEEKCLLQSTMCCTWSEATQTWSTIFFWTRTCTVTNITLILKFQRAKPRWFTEVLVRLQRLGNSTKCAESDFQTWEGLVQVNWRVFCFSLRILRKAGNKALKFWWVLDSGTWGFISAASMNLSVECRKITQFADSFSRMQHKLWYLNSSDWLSTMPHYSMASHTCQHTPEENKISQCSQIFNETNMCWTRK
jgi:hypothetical protein